MPPKPSFPSPAAVLPGEADILGGVIANLADDTAKLVYADWLEERDDPRGRLLRDFVAAFRAGKKLPKVKSAPKPWCGLLGFSVIAQLRGTVLGPATDTILALARPAIEYTPKLAPEKTIAVGASKLGGRPDLPAGTERPRFEDQPLSFLGQFNLAELHASPAARAFPATGLLSAFCLDLEDGDDYYPKGSWRLFYFPDPSKLVRRELDELAAHSQFPSCRVQYTEALTLPYAYSPEAQNIHLKDADKSDKIYFALYNSLCAGNHILGHTFPIQGAFWKKTERHLLTIGWNDKTHWEFGNCGALCFLLSDADLEQGRLDRVRMEMDGL